MPNLLDQIRRHTKTLADGKRDRTVDDLKLAAIARRRHQLAQEAMELDAEESMLLSR